MLDVALIGCQIDSQGKQLDSTDVGVGVEDEFDHIVHAVGVGQSVANASLGGEQVEYIQGSHAVGGILGEQVDEFGDE